MVGWNYLGEAERRELPVFDMVGEDWPGPIVRMLDGAYRILITVGASWSANTPYIVQCNALLYSNEHPRNVAAP